MNEKFNELIGRLQAAHGDNLASVVVFGSAIAAPGNARRTDYRLIVLTRWLSAEELRRARPVAQWWAAEGFAPPVYFTVGEFRDSLDVFPIEFRHMKRAYRLLYGQDLLAETEVSTANLRMQTEYELRGKLLRLRALYLPASGSVELLTKLMTDSVVSFVQFMRPILDLLGEEPPLSRATTARRVGEALNLDTAPLLRILRLRDEPVELLEVEALDLFDAYVDCIVRVIEQVDKL